MESAAIPLFGASATATLGYAAVSTLVARRKTSHEDGQARREILKHASKRARTLAEATGHIGKWYTLVPLALLGAGALARKRRYAAAATIATASIAAAAISPVLDRVMKFRAPPPGKERTKQSFPSGHALETTTVSVAAAWALAREGIVPGWVIAPVAIAASAISGLGRLVLDRHWSTDSAAGYCAGLALGCACAGAYELASRRL